MKMSISQQHVRAILADRIGALVKRAPQEIRHDRPLLEVGLDSATLADIFADLTAIFRVDLPPPPCAASFSLDALSNHVVAQVNTASMSDRIVRDDEPIAIVGMACRFPQASDPRAYWQLLCEGRCPVSEVPTDRWDAEGLYHPDPRHAGKAHSRVGYFLPAIDRFEPGFFGISPREALLMDPQQRLMLELSWEALEDAGQVIDSLRGSRTGVFFGLIWNDYGTLSHRLGFEAIAQHTVTGSHYSLLSNRVSYILGLQGPSLSFDAACATGLVATHLACESLRRGESTLALAGGVNLMIAPDSYLVVAKMGTLAPDGLCKAFDARADGFGRGEGAGVVVLKTLSRALRDGDRIYCLIRGSATNHNGNGDRLTMPHAQTQRDVMLEALRRARVDAERVVYVEAHGTGTRIGDPVEAAAIGAALGVERPKDRPLWIGSAKTNLGHLEGASGLVGLLKAALSIRHRLVPPSLHFNVPNPKIPFEELGLRVADRPVPLPSDGPPLVMGVNAFALGGTNCHVVLEEHRPRGAGDEVVTAGGPELITLSAHSPEALQTMAQELGEHLRRHPEIPLHDMAYTRNARRTHLAYRLAIVGRTHEDSALQLEKASATVRSAPPTLGPRPRTPQPPVVFVFSGQGGHWVGMGRALLADEPIFHDAFEACAKAFSSLHGAIRVRELLEQRDARLERPAALQPLLFSLQVALARLLATWGILPAAVIGHSLGEIAAAHIGGALSLSDAARIVHHRSLLSEDYAQRGGLMMVVDLTRDEARQAIAPFAGRIAIAAVNGPHLTVLAGDADAIIAIGKDLQRRGRLQRQVHTSHAWHSHHVAPAAAPLRAALSQLQGAPLERPFYSSVLGRACNGLELDADYWAMNLEQPVLFADAVTAALHDGHRLFLEIGPHPLLGAAIEQLAESLECLVTCTSTLRRTESERHTLLEMVGQLYQKGFTLDWSGLYPHGGSVVSLPGYRWQRQRFWAAGLAEAARGDGCVKPTLSPASSEEAKPPPTTAVAHTLDGVRAALRQEVAELLLLPPDAALDETSLLDLGLDSTAALRLRARCMHLFAWAPPLTTLLRGASLDAVVNEIWASIGEHHSSTPNPPVSEAQHAEAGPSFGRAEHPTTAGQRALWFLHARNPKATAYHLMVGGRIREPIDIDSLCAAWRELTTRHAVLRTTYHLRGESLLQVIAPETQALIQVDMHEADEDTLRTRIEDDAHLPFDLDAGPVAIARLYTRAPEDHVLLLVIHHIAVDGMSMAMLLDEFRELYLARAAGHPVPEPLANAGHVAYAAWERDSLAGPEVERSWRYWQSALAGDVPALTLPPTRMPGDSLPASSPRPELQTFDGAELIVELDDDVAALVRAFAKSRRVTLYTLILSGLFALLERYTGQSDLCVGSFSAHRPRAEFERAIGYYINPVAIRAQVPATITFSELLEQVGQRMLEALDHQDLPFATLIERLNPRRDPSRSPLFDIALNQWSGRQFETFTGRSFGARTEAKRKWLLLYPLRRRFARFDLEIALGESESAIGLYLQYNTDILHRSTVTCMVSHLQMLLRGALHHPDKPLSVHSLLTPVEMEHVISKHNRSNSAPVPVPVHVHGLHERFETQARRTPDAPAVRVAGKTLSYRELDTRANHIAAELRRRGVGPEVLVAVCVERSIHMVPTLLGVLKAGGAYVPIDPAYPRERIDYMIQDSGAALVLTTATAAASCSDVTVTVLRVDALIEHLGLPDAYGALRPKPQVEHLGLPDAYGERTPVKPDSLAYVIYTSGSTGRPKGVEVLHRGCAALFAWADSAFAPADFAVTLASTSICFDVSVFELFYPLSIGGTLIVVDSPLHLADLAPETAVTCIVTVPSAMSALVDLPTFPSSIRAAYLAGEPLRRSLVPRIHERTTIKRVYNIYGPTENTVYSTWTEVARDTAGEPTIGRPIPTCRAYVLDDALQPVPMMHTGELYLGGVGVARCYRGQPDLTRQRFLPDPFSREPDAVMYRTGDLARLRPDGEIELLGRRDLQIKLHGHRIELGEIEAAMSRHADVREAVVHVEESRGNRRLVGYLVPTSACATETDALCEEVRCHLERLLPSYMVPPVLVVLPEFPHTPNGKIDRTRLPFADNPHVTPSMRPAEVHRSPTAIRVTEVWAELLGLPPDKIGLHDTFYTLGGHSLLLARMAQLLSVRCERQVTVADLFRLRDIAALSEWLDAVNTDVSVLEVTESRAHQRRAQIARMLGVRS